ncbi:hypothetical protein VQ042_19615 [Aurantimonas sp. A2-1-M11]|uniref:hypothetical protein n=1 Tax=Aurantimonas sp. A2-1-M11 TaxID=3113712 RepID=UPI002F920119
MKLAITTAVIALFALGTAQAEELKPLAGKTIDLGGVIGAAYYTVEGDDFRVVTTLQGGETGSPLRFVSILSDGETLTVQVPSPSGAATKDLVISRTGNVLDMSPKADLRAAVSLR